MTSKLLQEENDLAKSLGFECIPDEARGWGYCYFAKNISKNERVVVWETSKGWCNARVINMRYTGHRYFDEKSNMVSLEKALRA